jgi:hypothetical protein
MNTSVNSVQVYVAKKIGASAVKKLCMKKNFVFKTPLQLLQ